MHSSGHNATHCGHVQGGCNWIFIVVESLADVAMVQIPKDLKAEKVDYVKDGAVVQCMSKKGPPHEPELT